MIEGTLQLTATQLARGGSRDVFQHPDHEHLLVKVVRAASKVDPGRPSPSALRRYGLYTPYVREMKEYVAVHVRSSGSPRCIQRCHGLVDTNLGLGMVVEKLCGADGGLAPNLARLVRTQGITTRIWRSAAAFHDEVRKHQLIVNDMHPSNVVWAHDGDEERLVLIDGLGEKNLIPIRTLIPGVNRWKIERDIKYFNLRLLRHAAELHWPKRYTRETAHKIPFEELIDRPPPA